MKKQEIETQLLKPEHTQDLDEKHIQAMGELEDEEDEEDEESDHPEQTEGGWP
jgi:hypothetical protein